VIGPKLDAVAVVGIVTVVCVLISLANMIVR
jgi:hypothetical protein